MTMHTRYTLNYMVEDVRLNYRLCKTMLGKKSSILMKYLIY